MTICTLPPVHHTIGEIRVDVVRAAGTVRSFSRSAIDEAAACTCCGATSDLAANRRPKSRIRADEHARMATLTSNQIESNQGFACCKTVAMLDNGEAACSVSACSHGPDCESDRGSASTSRLLAGSGGGGAWASAAIAVSASAGTVTTGIVTTGGVTNFTRTSSHSRFVRCGRLTVAPTTTATMANASDTHTLLRAIRRR